LEVNTVKENADLRLWSAGGCRFAWLFSLALHAGALVAMSIVTQATPQGAANDVTREGGIVLVARHGGEQDYFQDQSVVPVSFVAAEVASATSSLDRPPAPAPLEPALPIANAILPTAAPTTKTQGEPPPSRGPARAVETQVFGVRGKGSRFVYLFDRSSSMEGAALAAAKRELIASLQSLQSVHQFQIIFYNEQPQVMPDFRGRSATMAFADEPGKQLAARFVGGIFASGATDHVQALRTALQMRPDVIFLLTDANEPQLRADELRVVRQLNPGTSINAIEFGIGPPAPRYNFLQQLAAENGGQHTYVDVTRLVR
jgi:hypothetical protein